MSQRRAHRLNLTVNILFLAAGCASEAFGLILYRLAVVVIVLLLRALWARAVVRRARNSTARAILQSAESADVSDYLLDNASRLR